MKEISKRNWMGKKMKTFGKHSEFALYSMSNVNFTRVSLEVREMPRSKAECYVIMRDTTIQLKDLQEELLRNAKEIEELEG